MRDRDQWRCECKDNEINSILRERKLREGYVCYQRNNMQEQTQIQMVRQLRTKLHQTRSQNFILKQQLQKIKNYVKQIQQANQILEKQLQDSLQQLTKYDNQVSQYVRETQQKTKEVQQYKNELSQSKQFNLFLQEKINSLQQNLKQSQLTIQNNKRLIFNLNQQNQLLINIKKLLTQDNFQLKSTYQRILSNYQLKHSQINQLTSQIQLLIQQITQLQHILISKNLFIKNYQHLLNKYPIINHNNIEVPIKNNNYETLIRSNIHESPIKNNLYEAPIKNNLYEAPIKNNTNYYQNQVKNNSIVLNKSNNQQLQNYLIQEQVNRKLVKYKHKALKYKQQRDLLLQQIQEAKQEIGNITIRKQSTND